MTVFILKRGEHDDAMEVFPRYWPFLWGISSSYVGRIWISNEKNACKMSHLQVSFSSSSRSFGSAARKLWPMSCPMWCENFAGLQIDPLTDQHRSIVGDDYTITCLTTWWQHDSETLSTQLTLLTRGIYRWTPLTPSRKAHNEELWCFLCC